MQPLEKSSSAKAATTKLYAYLQRSNHPIVIFLIYRHLNWYARREVYTNDHYTIMRCMFSLLHTRLLIGISLEHNRLCTMEPSGKE